jgi:hypothetical protein
MPVPTHGDSQALLRSKPDHPADVSHGPGLQHGSCPSSDEAAEILRGRVE